ncbi:hypothetical protein AJ80_06775 [Polytolypa hystricis UAMH7299]|uniref:Uncharacterized protein n=1 Tax=Polytolypa hystricis (strain UAMH7299) TaxID=1447883 RepID=A0A2B7XU16_POLH7|nr:hypothetical protein AJ80_06775 [Polytolypa hystricis UAMH7299]
MADRNVTPDDSLLKQIFPTNQPGTISILLQDWDKCVFKAELPQGLEDQHSTCVVVRLEAVNENLKSFTTIAAMQRIAEIIIPDLRTNPTSIHKVGRKVDINQAAQFIQY